MTNAAPAPLTDRAALALRRLRARKAGLADFLHMEARAEIEDRLTLVNRRFTSPAIVTAHPEIWGNLDTGADAPALIIPDDDTLDLHPQQHDLVIHAMALHWANDPVGQIVQGRRALKDDGLFIAVAFGGQTLHELRQCLAEAESRITGGLSPRVLPMGEIRDMGGLLQRAGLALPVADSCLHRVTYRDAIHLMQDLRAMGETNAMSVRNRRPARREFFAQAAATYATHFPAEDGRVEATFELVYLAGWAPDDSQQKPLRPGSAQARLADALGTFEMPVERPPRPDDN